MASKVRPSSERVYQRQWSVFVTWCNDQGLNPFRIATPRLSDFFTFLKEEKKIQVSSIRSYFSVVRQTIEAVTDKEISRGEINDMLKGMEKQFPHQKLIFPTWDLSLVLRRLRAPPFEPLKVCEEKFLTFKTVFLVTLASAARRSEIHALSRDFAHNSDWTNLELSLLPDFLPKNQAASSTETRSFRIPAISNIVGREDKEDLLLCPVRAIRIYVDRMHSKPNMKSRRFFVSFKPGFTNEIHANTISSWLKQTVLLAYQLEAKSKELYANPKAHEIRSLSASLANHCNVALAEILKSCYWATHTTFTSFYLKDVTVIANKLMKLGSLVVLGKVLMTAPQKRLALATKNEVTSAKKHGGRWGKN